MVPGVGGIDQPLKLLDRGVGQRPPRIVVHLEEPFAAGAPRLRHTANTARHNRARHLHAGKPAVHVVQVAPEGVMIVPRLHALVLNDKALEGEQIARAIAVERDNLAARPAQAFIKPEFEAAKDMFYITQRAQENLWPAHGR